MYEVQKKMLATAILNGIPSDPDDPKSRFGAKGGRYQAGVKFG